MPEMESLNLLLKECNQLDNGETYYKISQKRNKPMMKLRKNHRKQLSQLKIVKKWWLVFKLRKRAWPQRQ